MCWSSPSKLGGAYPGTNGRIAFETSRDGNFEIYSINPDGTGETNLTKRFRPRH